MPNHTVLKNKIFTILSLSASLALTSCDTDEASVPVYATPSTYNFTGADFSTSTNRIKMAVELNSYLGSGTTTVLNQAKINSLFQNTNAPFTNASLNNAGVNLATKTADFQVFKALADQHAVNSSANATPAAPGKAGFIPRGTGKILVGPEGLEYNQAVAKGMMGSLFFKEAMTILANISKEDNNTATEGATAMQRRWDEAFGYLGIPVDYDPAKAYTSADADRPLLWGGYLAERGAPINAGSTLYEAFRKGRAAIGAKDYNVRDEQVKIIQETWEKLAAISALAYVTIPQASASVGNLGTQFHALSEGLGFAMSLKYRAAGSPLTEANLQRLVTILNTSFYTLVNEPGFAKLKEAETILKTVYTL